MKSMGKILIYPDPVLRKENKLVGGVGKQVLKEMEELKKILEVDEKGVGLAAPQLGVSKRFFGVKRWKKKGVGVVVLVNPKIVKTWGEKGFLQIERENGESDDFLEGCLSFPGIYTKVGRWFKIGVQFEVLGRGNRLFRKREIWQGFEAVVFQHELDHLEGVLLIDRAEENGEGIWKMEEGKMKETSLEKVKKGILR